MLVNDPEVFDEEFYEKDEKQIGSDFQTISEEFDGRWNQ